MIPLFDTRHFSLPPVNDFQNKSLAQYRFRFAQGSAVEVSTPFAHRFRGESIIQAIPEDAANDCGVESVWGELPGSEKLSKAIDRWVAADRHDDTVSSIDPRLLEESIKLLSNELHVVRALPKSLLGA